MTLLGTTGENQALEGLTTGTSLIGFVSLHTATTSTTGAAEVPSTGGYIRQAEAWNAASGGSKSNSGALSFTLVSATVTHCGTWTTSTVGVFGIGLPLGASVTAAAITVAAGALVLTAT